MTRKKVENIHRTISSHEFEHRLDRVHNSIQSAKLFSPGVRLPIKVDSSERDFSGGRCLGRSAFRRHERPLSGVPDGGKGSGAVFAIRKNSPSDCAKWHRRQWARHQPLVVAIGTGSNGRGADSRARQHDRLFLADYGLWRPQSFDFLANLRISRARNHTPDPQETFDIARIEKASVLVAHNMEFDEKILGTEFLRAGYGLGLP